MDGDLTTPLVIICKYILTSIISQPSDRISLSLRLSSLTDAFTSTLYVEQIAPSEISPLSNIGILSILQEPRLVGIDIIEGHTIMALASSAVR
jgi:hypothetical protein